MSFLYPAFLAGAVAVAIPIVLHFLRRDIAPTCRSARCDCCSDRLSRSRRRRLRDLLLLGARVCLLLLAAAFARPYVAGRRRGISVLIVAVDRSFSMDGPGRFAARPDRTRAAWTGPPGERVAIIAFDQ